VLVPVMIVPTRLVVVDTTVSFRYVDFASALVAPLAHKGRIIRQSITKLKMDRFSDGSFLGQNNVKGLVTLVK